MKNISFVKMSGAGNDFIIIDKAQNPEIVLTINVISRLCSRRNGIGADGIIIISDREKFDFSMDYFNADGSTGTLCGNGARCSIKFAVDTGKTKSNNVSFISNEIEYTGELLNNGLIKFNMKPPENIEENISLDVAGSGISASFLHTGSPHVVIVVDDIDDVPVIKIGKEIRYSESFAPEGTNVNFIETTGKEIFIRTYERGVEDETYACGTGAVAAAIIGNIKFGIKPPVSLHTKGGDELVVSFMVDGSDYKSVSLTGPVKDVFKGEISINLFS
ncbi:MAG: diaminopimelate epimerase [Bacteroidetes bacterium]|nr:diaminopimelate epimerase [Bacteroidota bacterium]